jgi:hypothetical protein
MESGTLSPASIPNDASSSSSASSSSKPSQGTKGPLLSPSVSNHVPGHNRRQSLVESLRGVPSSGSRSRAPSLTPSAVQDLLNNPPPSGKLSNPSFAGRDWRDISVGELSEPDDVLWAELDTTVEDATKVGTN